MKHVRVKVKSAEDGSSIEGARAVLFVAQEQPGPKHTVHGRTDAFGECTLAICWEVEPGMHVILRADHPEYLTALSGNVEERDADELGVVHAEIVMKPGETAAGRVIDEAGAPVGDAEVELTLVPPGLSSCSSIHRAARSDSEGRFEIRGCSPSNGRIRTRKVGWATTTLDVDLTKPSSDLVLTLRPGVVVGGVALNESGEPVGNDYVSLLDSENRHVASVRTDHAGRFRFAGVPESFTSGWMYFGQGCVERIAEARDGLVVRALPFVTVDVRLVDPQGEPVTAPTDLGGRSPASLHRRQGGSSTLCRFFDEGIARVHLYPVGSAFVDVRVDGYQIAQEEWDTSKLSPNGVRDLVLTPSRAVRGCVAGADGRPVPHVTVRNVGWTSHLADRETYTDREGVFTLDVVDERGWVAFSHPDHSWCATTVAKVREREAGGEKLCLLQGFAVYGKVTTGDGSPAEGEVVEAVFSDAFYRHHFHLPRTVVTPDGTYRLDHLPAPRVVISFRDGETIVEGQTGEEVRLDLNLA